jgi:glycosyltransferase involved in cell wall biosynthesis
MAELTRIGWRVAPIALNRPAASELQHPGAIEATASTFYVKAVGPWRALVAVLDAVRRSPLGMARLARDAARSGGSDLRRILWRLLQLGEACVVWQRCQRDGVHHLHAHFAQATATVARFAAAIGTRCGEVPWSWSFTVHGMHDVVDEASTDLGAKVADATAVVCVCDWLRAQVLRVSDPAHWSKVVVVRCGVDTDQLTPVPELVRPAADAAALRVVCLGRLSPEKGQLVLVEAIDMLRAAGRDVHLELVGAGPDSDRIMREIERRQLADAIRLVGELDHPEVVDRLLAADVCCLPSFAEGIPVSMMEAMALGVPVVASHVGGVPELAVDHCTAITVAPGDATALAHALGELADHPELRARLAGAARRAVEQAHDTVRNVAHLADLFALAPGTDPHR